MCTARSVACSHHVCLDVQVMWCRLQVISGLGGGACACRTLDAAALAANPVKLHKVESKLRYEEKMNKLQKQYSRRGSKETRSLLNKQGSVAGPASSAASEGSKKKLVAEPDWRMRLQQLAAINAERLRRLAEMVVQVCMINLPSPFKVCCRGVGIMMVWF